MKRNGSLENLQVTNYQSRREKLDGRRESRDRMKRTKIKEEK